MAIIVPNSIKPLGLSTTEKAGSGTVVQAKLPYQVLANRMEFWKDDDVGMFYAFFPVPPVIPTFTVIKITNDQNATVDKLIAPYATTTNRFSFQADIKNLPFGNFNAEIYTLNNQAEAEGALSLNGDAAVRKIGSNISGVSTILVNSNISGLPLLRSNIRMTTTGGFSLNGDAIVSANVKTTAEGGLNLSGNAIVTISANVKTTAEGGLNLSGNANAFSRGNIQILANGGLNLSGDSKTTAQIQTITESITIQNGKEVNLKFVRTYKL